MAANLDTLVTVFGGSGFLGRHVVRALAKRDYRIRVAVRRPELAGHLQPLGRVGQIHAVQANLRYPASVAAAMRDSHAAINLVGILSEIGEQTFDAVQGLGAQAVAKAAAAVAAPRPPANRPCFRPCRAPPSCAPRWCSAPRTSSPTDSPAWPGSRPSFP